MYDDGGRVVRTVTRGGWTEEDRALVMAYRRYQATLCRCGEPKERAWHWDNEGWYEVDPDEDFLTCHACTALARAENPEADPVRYPVRLRNDRDYAEKPLPPFDLGELSRQPSRTSKPDGGVERGGERPVGHSTA